eukprot:gnl/TRDRNA2_/TRDRNA2_39087_c0_seq1.p1 gnl/TRDRNA2_/TRDRNA2_39087_c0~~gnl/TRDRNA2_/TRDRNA2_39087_c0_seq1.p1  ORF type:complete len:306 (-),score=61.85 gnl/TRDRNA2_/TRDRNA2_39087_c0_seq1:76-993(-)
MEHSPACDGAAQEADTESGAARTSDSIPGDNLSAEDATRALCTAAWVGHTSAVKLLLASRVDPRARDAAGRPAIWLASRAGHHESLRALLEAGADPNDTWLAEAAGDEEPLDDMENRGWTCLAASSGRGRVDAVTLLLDARASIDSTGVMPPLLAAARGGHTKVVRMLLARNAAVDTCSPVDGGTPLVWSACGGHAAITSLLLDAKAAVDAPDKDGANALLWAASEGHVQVVQRILAADAHMEHKDEAGRTALSWACEGGHVEAARILLESKAQPDVQDLEGKTPLDIAEEAGFRDLFDPLLSQT